MTLTAALLSNLIPVVMLFPLQTRLALTLLFMMYFGLYMAVANSALIGFVSSIKETKTISIFMIGCATNSLIVLAIEIICLLAFKDKLLVSAYIYFGSTGLILVVVCLCFVRLVRKFQVKENLKIEWPRIEETYK